jgi:hypothetical protein
MEKGDAAEVVAKTVLAAATDPAPKRRYAAGKMAPKGSHNDRGTGGEQVNAFPSNLSGNIYSISCAILNPI